MEKLLSKVLDEQGDLYINDETLKELLKKCRVKTPYDLEKGDKVYVLHGLGIIEEAEWGDCPDHEDYRTNGNIALSYPKAAREMDRRRCETNLLVYGRREFREDKANIVLTFDHKSKQLKMETILATTTHPNDIYFDSVKICDQAVWCAGPNDVVDFLFNYKFDRSKYNFKHDESVATWECMSIDIKATK